MSIIAGLEQDVLVAAICADVDAMLLDSLDVSRGSEAATGSGLIFPLKGQSRRVSEQEVRFLFAHAVEAAAAHGKLHYAVEVPTEKTYHFSGQGERRASTDLALYLAPDLERPLLNVEFKAHGRSTNRSVHTAVRKDIAKLLAEPCDGLWYHLLGSANGATLEGLTAVLDGALVDLRDGGLSGYTAAPALAKRLYFHICVLERRLALHCCIDVHPGGRGAMLTVPACSVKQGALAVDDAGAWHVQWGATG